MRRRHFLVLLSSILAFAVAGIAEPSVATAKDGDGGGGGGNSGSGGGGDGGGRGGGDNSGRGGGDDNSGRGGGDDHSGRGGGDDTSGRGGGDDRSGRSGPGNDDGGGRGGRAPRSSGWGSTSPEQARDAVSQGWALPLSTILPMVMRNVPGQVLQVDLRQSWSGEWRYEFLILTADRRYREVVVDARRNQIIQTKRR